MPKKAQERAQTSNWYPTATLSGVSEIKRLLKPIKGDIPGGPGGHFSDFKGGTAHA
jgi:hypothetical protein